MAILVKTDDATETGKTATFNSQWFSPRSGTNTPAKLSAFVDVTQVMTTTPSITVKYQYSHDGILATDVTSGAFSAITAIGKATLNGITWPAAASYYRYVATIAGTGSSFNFALKTIFHD